jgi:hypothetical protein
VTFCEDGCQTPATDASLASLPPSLANMDFRVVGMIYLRDERDNVEGYGEIAIYRCAENRVRLEVSRDGAPLITWENSLNGTPLFRAMVASIVQFQSSDEQVPASPPLAYLIAGAPMPHPSSPSRSAAHLSPDSGHASSSAHQASGGVRSDGDP